MSKKKYFINLTTGIEAISEHNLKDVSFIRIQSSLCERKEWLKILMELDYNFLMHIALGYECHVFDYGARKPVSRAMYQGLLWVKYALNRYWFGIIDDCFVKGNDASEYFNFCYERIFVYDNNKEKESLKKKLRYFCKFIKCSNVNIVQHNGATINDCNFDYYNKQLDGYISK